MSVFNRLSDIVNANLNAMLEKAEDPEKMVRMITREMEETLVEVRSASARHLADRKQVESSLQGMKRQSREWDQKAEMAVTKGRDDLARAALAQRRDVDDNISHAEAEIAALDNAIAKLKEDTRQLEDKLSQARARQKALILRGKTVQSRMKVREQINNPRFEDSLTRFEACERRLDEMEGQLESWELGDLTLRDEINALEEDTHMDEELAALKARMQSASQAQSSATAS